MEDHANFAAELLALATENAELRLKLAEAQDQCIELAVDAGELHVEITALRLRLARVVKQRDAWQAEAERRDGRAVA
jgi:RES domain-containing protein